MSATSSMLGMGVTISLRDLFTTGAHRIARASNGLTATMVRNQKAISAANKQFAIGGGMMVGGGLLAGLLGLIGYKAVRASSDMQKFHLQFATLMKGNREEANQLFKDVTKFAAATPFTIPGAMQAAKNLKAFQFATKDVTTELKIAGDWAAILNVGIDRTTEILGRVNTGAYGTAIRALRALAVNPRELAKYGVPIKDGIMKKGTDPKIIMAGLNKYLVEKFGGGMDAILNTIPGRISNIQDKMILGLAKTGDAMNGTIYGIVKKIEESLEVEKVQAFAGALGQGLDMCVKAVVWLLTPFAIFAKSVISVSESHPGIVKVGTALVGVAAAALITSGAFIMLAAAHRLIQLSQAGAMWKIMRMRMLACLPVIGWIALGVFALVAAFKSGDKTVMQTLKLWYDNLASVVGGLVELFSSINNGVGTMSMSTANKLRKAGLLDAVISIFMAGYRLYQVVAGAFQSFSIVMTGVGWVLGRIVWVVDLLISAVGTLTGWLGLAGRTVPTNAFKVFGNVLGIVVAWMLLFNVYTKGAMAWTFISTVLIPGMSAAYITLTAALRGGTLWMGIAKAATWAFNAALWANPIVWIVGAILALIVALVLLVVHFDKVKAKLKEMPDWVIVALGPFNGVLLVIKYWDRLGRIMHAVAGIGKIVWRDMMDFILDTTIKALVVVAKLFKTAFKFIPSWALPGDTVRTMQLLADDKTRELGVQAFKKSMGFLPSGKDQSNGLTGSFLDKLGNDLDMMHGLLAAGSKQPVTVPVYIDGKKIAEVVTKRQNDEHDSGR